MIEHTLHPIYNLYGATKDGYIVSTKKTGLSLTKGSKSAGNYLVVGVRSKNMKKYKTYPAHKFVWECHNNVIPNGMVIDHINNVRDDNRLQNLQLVTPKKNCKKDPVKRDYSFAVNNHANRKNVKATCIEDNSVSYYESLYSVYKALKINAGIVKMCAEGLNNSKSGKSKVNGLSYKFEYVNTIPGLIEVKEEDKPFLKRRYTCSHCGKELTNASQYAHDKRFH